MRIIYFASSAIPSHTANSIQVMSMCNAFAKCNVDIELVVPWRPEKIFTMPNAFLNVRDHYGIIMQFPIRYIFNPIPTIGNKYLWKMRNRYYIKIAQRYSGKAKHHLAYTRSPDLAIALVDKGIPVVVECHEYELYRDRGDLERLLKAANSPLLRLIVAISANLKRLYVEFGLPESKIMVAHDGVDEELLDSGYRRLPLDKMKIGIPNGKPVVCYAGKMSEDRGIKLLLDATKILPDYYFMFVGETKKEIVSWHTYINNSKNVKFIGFVPPKEVAKYLKMADILVAPYTTKIPTFNVASPLKVFEYMAMGKSTVMSNLPTIQEVATDGYDAILVEPDSVRGLVDGLRRAQDHEMLHIGTNARKTMEQYTWQVRAQRILDALK